MSLKLPVLLAGALMLAACSSTPSSQTSASSSSTAAPSSSAAPQENRAVVIMSGGGAISPFTTPTQACSDEQGFLSAGNTDTALRDYLLAQGKQVYTAPATAPWGTVTDQDPASFGPFKDCPPQLPESMTVMSTGDIDAAGEKLARFLNYLNTEYGVTDVDLVGHSNGGLFSRAAIRILKQTDAPIRVRSLTMMGTPILGGVPTGYSVGEFTKADCMGNEFCLKFNEGWLQYADSLDKGLNREDTRKYLDGETGWNAAQAGYLDGIPVTLMAGTYFTADGGDPKMWPYDGIVARYSAWAVDVPDSVIPWRTCWEAPLTHSIFVSDAAGLPWDTGITWNADALKRVNQAIDEADTALTKPNRQGC